MTRHLLIRTRTVRIVELLEVEAASEEYARLKAAELKDTTPEVTILEETLDAAAAMDLDQETLTH